MATSIPASPGSPGFSSLGAVRKPGLRRARRARRLLQLLQGCAFQTPVTRLSAAEVRFFSALSLELHLAQRPGLRSPKLFSPRLTQPVREAVPEALKASTCCRCGQVVYSSEELCRRCLLHDSRHNWHSEDPALAMCVRYLHARKVTRWLKQAIAP